MFSLSKLRSFLPGQSSSEEARKRHSVSLDPEVGFQLTLEPQSTAGGASANGCDRSAVPELNVQLIAARHLPSTFGFKSVQGYVVKVKLFPGSTKFDSTIQTCSWPKFNEHFKFPLGSELKSSIKKYSKDKSSYETLPEQCFSGHFVVFTVYALLELPPGSFDRFKGTYRSLRDKGVNLLKAKAEANKKGKDESQDKVEEMNTKLTKSETKRNIGSVTCYLEPKIFKKSTKGPQFITDEIWLPIKDITVTQSKKYGGYIDVISNQEGIDGMKKCIYLEEIAKRLDGWDNDYYVKRVNTSPKGQIELVLEVYDSSKEEPIPEETPPNGHPNAPKRQWSLTEMKKKIKNRKFSKSDKDYCLKVSTTKMRCSIKVKDEFEATAGQIYVKTSIFEHDILLNSWKTDLFLPTLSNRWDPEFSTIEIPLEDDATLQNITIKTTVATKNKMGKKIVLGTILLGPNAAGLALEHWKSATSTRNESVAMYHNFI